MIDLHPIVPERRPLLGRARLGRGLLALVVLALVSGLGAAWAQEGSAQDGSAQESGEDATLLLHDFADGAPSGRDAAGNGVGFVTWQDGSSTLELSVVEVEPGSDLALPDQRDLVSLFRVQHDISSWGGFTHAFADESAARWVPLDLSGYQGIRFWYRGDGRGGPVQVDLFDNRNPELPGDSAERYAYRFVDDSTEWRRVEVPFDELFRRTDFQPGGAPDDGLTLSQVWGWAMGFAAGDGVSHVYGVEAYGRAGELAEGEIGVELDAGVYDLPEAGEVEIRLRLSRPSEEAVSVRAFVQADSARGMRDIVERSELVVFPPGATEAGFVLRAIDDDKHEGDERAVIALDGPVGAALGFQRRAIVRIVDDDPPVAGQIADFEDGPAPFTADGAELAVEELLVGTPAARPEQGRFEHVLVASGAEAPFTLQADLAPPQDWSGGEALSFWFRGRGDGGEVAVTLLDAPAGPPDWRLAWSDEFDAPAGTSPDWSVWTPELGDGTANGIPGWGNGELQAYTDQPENVAHDGEGRLVITARESGAEAPPCYYDEPCRYTSARLITQGALEIRYGRIEARMKLPAGAGLWPAFWLLGNDIGEVGWPASGEIDVMENIGREPSTVHGTIHGPGYSGGDAVGRPFRLPANARFADDFHDFALEWEADELRWYVDGVLYSTLTPADLPRGAAWVFDHPFFVILNVAVGGAWPGPPDASTVFPQSLVVEHVRVFEAADRAERWGARFVDGVAGWRRVELPVSAFGRAADQPEGAPDDGLGLEQVAGMTMRFGAGEAVRIDDLRVLDGE